MPWAFRLHEDLETKVSDFGLTYTCTFPAVFTINEQFDPMVILRTEVEKCTQMRAGGFFQVCACSIGLPTWVANRN